MFGCVHGGWSVLAGEQCAAQCPATRKLDRGVGNTERSVQNPANDLEAHEKLNAAVMAAASATYAEEEVSGEGKQPMCYNNKSDCSQTVGRAVKGVCKDGATTKPKSFKRCDLR